MPVSLPESIETDLIEKSRLGDRSAFGELVLQYQHSVVHLVYRMCSDLELSEDAAQEAFLRAWLHLDDFQRGSSLRNWLFRIAINVALDKLRLSHGMLMDLEKVEVMDPTESPEEKLVNKESSQRVQNAIQALSESNRAVLVLREYGGLCVRGDRQHAGYPGRDGHVPPELCPQQSAKITGDGS